MKKFKIPFTPPTTQKSVRFPNNMIEGTVSVRFYPLANEDADYNTMADIYRDYLTGECGLKENANDKAMNVNILR